MDRAAIVEVFRERIAAVVGAARAHLDALPGRAELPIFEEYAAGVGVPADEHAADKDRLVADTLNRSAMGMPPLRLVARYPARSGKNERREPYFPDDAPNTYGEAVAFAENETETEAERLADDLLLMVDTLVAPEVRGEVLARADEIARRWPLWARPGLDHAVWEAVWKVTNPTASEFLSLRRLPVDVDPAAVAAWARPGINAAYARTVPGGAYPPGDDLVDPEFGGAMLVSTTWGDGRYRFEAGGMALLYAAEREARWNRLPVFAAVVSVEATRTVLAREPVSAPVYNAVVAVFERELQPPPDAPVGWKVDAVTLAASEDLPRRFAWAAELLIEARKISGTLFGGPAPSTDADALALADAAGARFAEALAELGGTGRQAAGEVRESEADRRRAALDGAPAGARWRLWFEPAANDDPPRWLRLLARVLWAERWRPIFERARRPVALSLAAMNAVDRVLSVRGIADGHDGRELLVDAHGRPVARFQPIRGLATAVDADALEGLTRGGVRGLATVAAVRFVPWFAETVQRRPAEREPLTFVGSDGVNAWGIVAAELGMDPAKNASDIRGMLLAMQATIVSYPDGGEAGLLMLDYRPGGGRGNPSRLTLTPGRPWWASDVHDLPAGAEYRALAPIPKLEGHAPPFVGDRSERAALARLYLRVLAELARDAPDIARGLGAHIPPARWMQLAIEVGVRRPPPLLIPALSDRWTRDGDDGAAILERVGLDRWNLAPRFVAEREMLEAGGRLRIGAAEGGRRASKARAAAADRMSRKGGGKGGGKGGRSK